MTIGGNEVSGTVETLGGAMLGRDLTAASHDLGLTDVLLVSEIASQRSETGPNQVVVRASRPLNQRQQQLIADRIVELAGAASQSAPQPSGRIA